MEGTDPSVHRCYGKRRAKRNTRLFSVSVNEETQGASACFSWVCLSRADRIRTCDLLVPKHEVPTTGELEFACNSKYFRTSWPLCKVKRGLRGTTRRPWCPCRR